MKKSQKKTIVFIFFLLMFRLSALAAQKDKVYGQATVSEIFSIYDGDTFRCNIIGFPAIIGEHIGVRIAGIDTPELRDNQPHIRKLALQAKQYTVKRLREGKKITLKNMRRGKYFRIVAEVWVDGNNLGNELMSKGLARKYSGGKKPKW